MSETNLYYQNKNKELQDEINELVTKNNELESYVKDEASTTITANYINDEIKLFRKNGGCLVTYSGDWSNFPAGNLGILGTIPEGYRPPATVQLMCAPYNEIQIAINKNGEISAYNYGSANSGASAGRFSFCYIVG